MNLQTQLLSILIAQQCQMIIRRVRKRAKRKLLNLIRSQEIQLTLSKKVTLRIFDKESDTESQYSFSSSDSDESNENKKKKKSKKKIKSGIKAKASDSVRKSQRYPQAQLQL